MPDGSTIEIVLPPGTNIDDLNAVDATTGEPRNVTTYIDGDGNTVVVIEAFPDDNDPDTPGTTSGKVIIDFGNVTNPPDGGTLGPFNVKVKDPDGNSIIVVTPTDPVITDPIDQSTCASTCKGCAGTPDT